MPFLKPQDVIYSNFASLFSVVKDNPSMFFSSNLISFEQKRVHKSEIFRLLNGWVKIHQISRVMFGTKSKFFF